jgi:hypothetical protein
MNEQSVLRAGLCVIRRFAPEKGVDHVAILDATNQLGNTAFTDGAAVRYEVLPERGLQASLHDFSAAWTAARWITNQRAAAVRLAAEWRAGPQSYDLAENNCEHFASRVELGVKRSPQLDTVVWVGIGVLALIALAPGARSAA